MIRKLLTYLLPLLLLAACGEDDRFAVEGTMEGGRTTNLRIAFYNGDAFVQGITAVRDGRFSFEATAPQPVMVELYDNDYRLLGRLYAAKGDEITCNIDPANPFRLTATGRKDLERWTRWQRDHADALLKGSADSLVEQYIAANPGDVVSTLLLTTLYDASTPEGLHRADSLLSLIAPEARPFNITQSLVSLIAAGIHGPEARLHDFKARILGHGPDTLRIASSPLWLISLATEHTQRRDSVVPAMRRMHHSFGGRDRLRVVEISLDNDTTAWRRITRPDSAAWTQAWLPGGTAARGIDSLAVPTLPYFIVADSTGRQLLRTPSPSAATAFIEQRLK